MAKVQSRRQSGKSLSVTTALLLATALVPGAAVAADPPFSLVVLPDTQYYSKSYPSIYKDQASWIVGHRDSENIQFVLHMGDITDQNTTAQWSAASQAHSVLDSAGIPYSVLPGNHDMPSQDGVLSRDTSLYNTYFGPSRFTGRSWYGGNFQGRNENNYNLFELGSLKFLVVNLEFAPRKDALCWANDLVDRYPDRRVIIATHCYQTSASAGSTTPGGHRTDCGTGYNIVGSGGDDVWRELVRRHNNVFMVLSGHVGDSEHRVRTGPSSGHVVHEILTDYQFERAGGSGALSGNGWLRLLRFQPSANRVDVASQTVVQPGHAYHSPFFPDGIRFYLTNVYSSSPSAVDHRYSFSYDLTSSLPPHNSHSGSFEPFNDRTVNSRSGGEQVNPAIASSRTGASVVAWQDDQDGNGYYQILARAFDPSGCGVVQDFTVNTVASGQQINPAAASDANGSFVVVWQDDQDSDGEFDIYARGFNANGTQRFPQLRVNVAASGQQRNPKVAMDDSGNFVVVWEDDQDSNGYYQLLARGFSASGAQRLATWTVNSVADGQQFRPAIAMSPGGSFVIAWEDDQDDNGWYQILARGFTSSGAQRFADRTVNGVSDGQQRRPAVAMDSSGNFVVVWEDDQDANRYYQLLARGFSVSGAQRLATWTVNSVSGGQQLRPAIAMSPGGDFAVTWEDDQDNNGWYQILARGFYSSGAQRFGQLTVNSTSNGQQRNAGVAMDGSANLVVVWEDDIDGNGVREIVARGLNAGGGVD